MRYRVYENDNFYLFEKGPSEQLFEEYEHRSLISGGISTLLVKSSRIAGFYILTDKPIKTEDIIQVRYWLFNKELDVREFRPGHSRNMQYQELNDQIY